MPVQLNALPPEVKELDITLSWNKLQDEREPIEKYTVYRRTLNGFDDVPEWTELTTENSSVCEYLVKGLERGKKYEFLVTATNQYGEGLNGQGVKVKVSKGNVHSMIYVRDAFKRHLIKKKNRIIMKRKKKILLA